MLLLSMFIWPKMGYIQGKIGLTRQFDRHQPGNYLQPGAISCILASNSVLNID